MWEHVVSVEKHHTAKVIPNAIEVKTFNGKKVVILCSWELRFSFFSLH